MGVLNVEKKFFFLTRLSEEILILTVFEKKVGWRFFAILSVYLSKEAQWLGDYRLNNSSKCDQPR